jgi:sulfite exporter TauE/SafE
MLASIHPLGERARGQSFAVTVAAYTLGSVAGAAVLGALLGALGGRAFSDGDDALRLGLLAAAAVIAAVLDRSGRPIPSWRRQVNEDWLSRYRGWVYGLGFGVQLGLGVVTIVTTAAVYLTWVAAFVAGSAALGATVGAAFGLARALPLLAAGSVRTPDAIRSRVAGVDARAGRFRVVTVAVEVLAAVTLLAVAVR